MSGRVASIEFAGHLIKTPLRLSAVRSFEEATGTSFDELLVKDMPEVDVLARLVYCALVDQGAALPGFGEWLSGQAWPDVVGAGLALQADSVKRIEAMVGGHVRFLARELNLGAQGPETE